MRQPTSARFRTSLLGYAKDEVDALLSRLALERHAWELDGTAVERERAAAAEAAARWDAERECLIAALTDAERRAAELDQAASSEVQALFDRVASSIVREEAIGKARAASLVAEAERQLADARLQAAGLLEAADRRARSVHDTQLARIQAAVEEFHLAREAAAALLDDVGDVVRHGRGALSSLSTLEAPASEPIDVDAILDEVEQDEATRPVSLVIDLAG